MINLRPCTKRLQQDSKKTFPSAQWTQATMQQRSHGRVSELQLSCTSVTTTEREVGPRAVSVNRDTANKITLITEHATAR